MDPLSQGVLGAAAAQAFAKKPHIRTAALTGWLGGMAADLDIFFRSSTDPLYSLEMHRHFTHSLAFIPFGGLFVGFGLWLLLYRKKHKFRTIYIYSTLGYATHGLLDACTSYGTRLLWPLSDFRVAWDNVAIVDPLFTIPLLVLASIGWRDKSLAAGRIALAFGIGYLSLGAWQNHKVSVLIEELAQKRGHIITKHKLNPTIGNLIVWRSVYQQGDEYVIDAVRMPMLFGEARLYEGISIPVFKPSFNIPKHSVLAHDIERFSYFSQGFLYEYSKNVIADVRYSMVPHAMVPLWGIKIDPEKPQQHASRAHLRAGNERKLDVVWEMFKNSYDPVKIDAKTLEKN